MRLWLNGDRIMPSTRKEIRGLTAIDVVEAAYRLEGTESDWLDTVLARARPDLDTGCGVYAFTGYESVPNFDASPAFVQHDLDAQYGERLAEVNRTAPRALYDLVKDRLVTCGGLVQTLGLDSPIVAQFHSVMKPIGVEDGFSLFAQDAEGGSITLSAPSKRVVTLVPRVRGIWRRVGLHVASALRLRRKMLQGGTVRDALFDTSGNLHDATPSVSEHRSARDVLVRAVTAMEEARSKKLRASPERALALWQGLVAGEWSLVEHWESGGRRYLAAYRNRPDSRDPRALTPTERSMLSYLSLGATNKDIEFALGLPSGTVSSSVTRILKKLRVKRRVDLAVLADPSRMERIDVPVGDTEVGVLTIGARPPPAVAALLSHVELEVASYATRGWSNERIASQRQVSVHTVANQLRAIYEKLGISSRSQLARAMTE
jgi:DNA-binding NarL/FixJ family response regulator